MYTILFRNDGSADEEMAAARKYFPVVTQRSKIYDATVIGRYSVLPFYGELEADLENNSSMLINSHSEHRWISSFDWYEELKEFTPRSWSEREMFSVDHPGPFVLKGRTNSRKNMWSTHMFAKNKKAAYGVASKLANDPLVGPQGIIYREYLPLRELDKCVVSGLPLVNEWRFFFYQSTLLSYGFYWTNIDSDKIPLCVADKAMVLAYRCARICSKYVKFFVLDVAETATGEWILIEVNDAQMSGLSFNDPNILYRTLKRVIGG